MPTTSPKPKPLPTPDVPLIDTQTGRISPVWYEWLKNNDAIMRQLRVEIP